MPIRTLRVVANPYCAELDHEGRAHGHIPYEPDPLRGEAGLRFIGCELVATALRAADPKNAVRSLDDHAYVYDTEPTTVLLSPYYLSALRQTGAHGPALFAADIETHMLVFGRRDGFVAPQERLARLGVERGGRVTFKPKEESAHE